MIIKKYLYYFEAYMFYIPVYMIHEISHWLFVVVTWMFSLNSFPKVVVVQWPTIEYYGDNNNCSKARTFAAHVSYNTAGHLPIMDALCAVMPAVATALLFYYSPWYVCIYLLANIGSLWLSNSDIVMIKKPFTIYKRNKEVNEVINDII